ncbi:MAG: helix-turn-helix domain-containing protein [Rhodospirillales bacterium]|nr:helix-turn-helix domain-containing protein [Rhodospirillales bacterium]
MQAQDKAGHRVTMTEPTPIPRRRTEEQTAEILGISVPALRRLKRAESTWAALDEMEWSPEDRGRGGIVAKPLRPICTKSRAEVDPLLSPAQARKTLGCGETFFGQLVRAGEIEFILIGKRRKFRLSVIEAFLERQTQPCPSINTKSRRTTTSISKLKDNDFLAARALRLKAKHASTKQKCVDAPLKDHSAISANK